MHRFLPFAVSFLVAACLLAACGGQTDGSSSDAGSTNDGSTSNADAGAPNSAWSPVCPIGAPAEGAACNDEALDCEYGCGNVFTCADGTWGGASLIGGAGPCDDGAPPNAASCPATLSAVTAGASCSNAYTRCVYPDGFCECDSPQDPTPDAGSSWVCGPQAGCPPVRPRIGSSCNTNEECDYEQCGGHEICQGGAWQPSGGGGCGG